MNVAGEVRAVRAALRSVGTPARAAGAKAYLNSNPTFLRQRSGDPARRKGARRSRER